MPCYPYECIGCGHTMEVFKSMSEFDTPELCPKCDLLMDRIFTRCASLDDAFYKPIEMFSVAPTGVDEYRQLRKKLPDVEFTPQLVPLAHSRSEKLRILKAVGYEEHS